MVRQQAFRVKHPLGTFMAILAWNTENYTDAISILRIKLGDLAELEELDHREIQDWATAEGWGIILLQAE